MKLLIRADAFSEIGHGHVMRCLTLSRALQKIGFSVGFAYQHMSEDLEKLKKSSFRLFKIKVDNLVDDSLQTHFLAKRIGAQTILIDGYQFNSDYFYYLSQHMENVIVMDDLNDRGKLSVSMVINAMPNADMLGYQDTAPEAVLLLGLRYTLLRGEFCNKQSLALASRRPRLLVNFGGSDILALSLPVVQRLLEEEPGLPITLITGEGMRKETITQLMSLKYPDIEHIHNCQNMAEQMNRAGLALAAPGGTVYELAACGVPSVFLLCAKNQRFSAMAHEQYGWCRLFDGRIQLELDEALRKSIQLWNDPMTRDKMQKKTYGLVDSEGSKRIASKIYELAGDYV